MTEKNNSDKIKMLWNEGLEYLKSEKYEDAINNFEQIIKEDENDCHCWINLCFCYREINNLNRAMECIDKAISIDNNNILALTNKGMLLESDYMYESAIEYFEKILKLNENDKDALFHLGSCYQGLSSYKKAINIYNKLLKNNENDTSLLINKGACLHGIGDEQESYYCYKRAVEIDKNNATAWQNLGFCLIRFENYNDAEQCVDKALEINSKINICWCLKYMIALKRGNLNEALIYFSRFYYLSDTMNEFKDIYLFNSVSEIHKYIPAPYLYYRILSENPRLQEIISLSNLIGETTDNFYDILRLINYIKSNFCQLSEITKLRLEGIIKYYSGDSIESKKIFNDMIKTDSTEMSGHYYLLMSLYGYAENSEREMQEALKQAEIQLNIIKNENITNLYYSGQIYILDNQIEKALICFEKSENFLPSLYMKSYLLNESGKNEDSKSMIEKIYNKEYNLWKEKKDGFLRGYEKAFIDINNEHWEEPFIKFANAREIAESFNNIYNWIDENEDIIDTSFIDDDSYDGRIEAENISYDSWILYDESKNIIKNKLEQIDKINFEKLREKLEDISCFNLLEYYTGRNFDLEFSKFITETNTEQDKSILLLTYFYHKGTISQHSAILLLYYIYIKEIKNHKSNIDFINDFIEITVVTSLLGLIKGLNVITHTVELETDILFATLGRGIFKILKKYILENINEESLNDFLTFKLDFIKYINNLKEKYEIDNEDSLDILDIQKFGIE